MTHSTSSKGGDIVPVKYLRGCIIKSQHTFTHSDRERQIIEKHMKKQGLTYNGAIRDIVRRYGESAGYSTDKPQENY